MILISIVLFSCCLAVNQARPEQKGWDDSSELLTRFVGETEAKKNSFPHHVSLYHGDPLYNDFTFVGSGAILNDRWILTAASIVFTVFEFGKHAIKAGKIDQEIVEDWEQFVMVEKVYTHPGYSGGKNPSHNIALLKLEKPLVFNSYIAAIALPQKGEIPEGYTILSKWSINEEKKISKLQFQSLPIVNYTTCKSSLLTTDEISSLSEKNLCTGPLTGNYQGAQSQDIGSPLIIRHPDTPDKLIGIVSWQRFGEISVAAPSVYSRISAYSDWIKIMMTDLRK